MTAYVPRHALTSPRTWQRARRPSFFRSVLRLTLRKPFALARRKPDLIELPASTGQLARVHPREHLGPERPTTLQRPDGQVVIDEYNHVELYPWPAAERPGCPVPTEGWRADDTRYDLPLARPYAPTNQETRELYFTRGLSPDCANGCHAPLCSGRNCSCGCHGKAAPVADVLEGERLAAVMQP